MAILALLVALISGLAIGYFAIQNTAPVAIRLNDFVLEEVPLYLVMLGSLFAGLFIAWILYLARTVSSSLIIYGKDHAMKRAQQTTVELERQVRQLQVENARLKTAGSSPSPPDRDRARWRTRSAGTNDYSSPS
jgi:uncharacterized integral membrane protein